MAKIKTHSTCKVCGETKPRENFRLDRYGYLKGKICSACNLDRMSPKGAGRNYIYRQYKKTYCETCGVSYHRCQLDVDHIDGDHSNNDPTNLQTLCANCHRLKTYNQRRVGLTNPPEGV